MSIFERREPELTDAQLINRGREAERLLKSELLQEAATESERDLVVHWAESKDRDYREACWAGLQSCGRIIGYLRIVADRGVAAQAKVK